MGISARTGATNLVRPIAVMNATAASTIAASLSFSDSRYLPRQGGRRFPHAWYL